MMKCLKQRVFMQCVPNALLCCTATFPEKIMSVCAAGSQISGQTTNPHKMREVLILAVVSRRVGGHDEAWLRPWLQSVMKPESNAEFVSCCPPSLLLNMTPQHVLMYKQHMTIHSSHV